MSINWGSWSATVGGNAMRVGIEATFSTVTHASPSVTVTWHIYTQNLASWPSDSQVLTYTGGCASGTTSFTNADGTVAVLRAIKTCTHTYAVGSYGSSPGTFHLIATLSGAYNGITPAKSYTTDIPARPIAAPAAPSGLVATYVSDSTVNLDWTNNATTAAPYGSQILERRIWVGPAVWGDWAVLPPSIDRAAEHAVIGAQLANRVYQYRIHAHNSVGDSAVANSGAVATTPAAPTSVHSKHTGAPIVTTWTANHYTGATSFIDMVFEIQRSNNGGSSWADIGAVSGTVTTFSDASPLSGTSLYRVRARNVAAGLASAYVTGNTVTGLVAPLAPTALFPAGGAADLFAEGYTFTWQHNHGGDWADQSAYTVQFSSDSGATWTAYDSGDVLSSVSSHTVPPGALANGVTYLWRVRTRGITSAGFGPYSASGPNITGSTRPVAVITSPTDPASLPITVTWTYTQAEGSPQASAIGFIQDAFGADVEAFAISGSTTSQSLVDAYDSEHSPYTLTLLVYSAAGLVNDPPAELTFSVVETPPASVNVAQSDYTYQPCSGTVVLSLCVDEAVIDVTEPAVSITVERMIENPPGVFSDWQTIATGVPAPVCPERVDVLDLTPVTAGVNWYRFTTISALPSYFTTTPQSAGAYDGNPLNIGGVEAGFWVFVSYGDSFEKILRMRGDLDIGATTSRVRETQHFLGRGFPALLVGTNKDRVVNASGSINWTEPYMCVDYDDLCRYDSPADDWETLGLEAEIVLYRDYTGRRVYGRLGEVAVSDLGTVTPTLRAASVSFDVTEVEYDEVTGVWPEEPPT